MFHLFHFSIPIPHPIPFHSIPFQFHIPFHSTPFYSRFEFFFLRYPFSLHHRQPTNPGTVTGNGGLHSAGSNLQNVEVWEIGEICRVNRRNMSA